jgi:hypothetical protein
VNQPVNHARTHAIILGASFIISLAIVGVRMSLGGRTASSKTEGPRVVKPVETESDQLEEEDPVERVTRYLEEADGLLKSSAGVEGREGEIHHALKILGEAQVILETLSREDSRVKLLTIRCQEMRQIASRVANL